MVVALGAEPVIPDIKGLQKVEYTTGQEVLAGKKNVGATVLIIGGGMVGVETAEFLAERGKEVTVIEMLDKIARDMETITRTLLMKRIQDLPIRIMTNTVVKSFEKGRVVLEENGEEKHLPKFDTVVFAVGSRSVDGMTKRLQEQGIETYAIGDARRPRKVLQAIHEGFEVGLKI